MGGEKLASDLSRDLLNLYLHNRQIAEQIAQRSDLDNPRLLDLLEYIQRRWVEEAEKNTVLQDRVRTLETELNTVRNEQLSSNEHLRHARAQIATLISEKEDLKMECENMKRDFQLVKDILKPEFPNLSAQEQKRLAFLDDFGSTASSSDPTVAVVAPIRKVDKSDDGEVDYDKTEEPMDQTTSTYRSADCRLRSGKVYKRSHIQADHVKGAECNSSQCVKEVPAKRIKDSTLINSNTLVTSGSTCRTELGQVTPVRRSMNRSFSESDVLTGLRERYDNEIVATVNQLPHQSVANSVIDVRTTPVNPLVCSWTKGCPIENREHTFTNYTSIIGDKCDVCGRWIGIGSKPAFKCNDCNLHIHKVCVSHAPVPCVPHMPTPRTPGKQRPRLIDFCPQSRPMIPNLIIHCVLALENYYLKSEGLYRIPGQESQVLKLLNEFKTTRFQPKLRSQDPETITGCIKRFLSQLRDSLIPSSSWDEFVTAANQHSQGAIDRCINDLPAPHKDTLAFLCNHFQKVCSHSSVNKMTPEVLAKSIAPTIVGRAPMRTMNLAQGSDEAIKQTQVLLALLDMPPNYWPKFYSCEMASSKLCRGRVLGPSQKQLTPGKKLDRSIMIRSDARVSPSAADRSILGPIRTPPVGSKIKPCHIAYNRKNICLNPY